MDPRAPLRTLPARPRALVRVPGYPLVCAALAGAALTASASAWGEPPDASHGFAEPGIPQDGGGTEAGAAGGSAEEAELEAAGAETETDEVQVAGCSVSPYQPAAAAPWGASMLALLLVGARLRRRTD
jgi:MYXO-CTERM domain-containing protein